MRSIGRGAWCETYWLPEADLVTLGPGSTVNRGCVVQTHLFHDRIMRMDEVVFEPARHWARTASPCRQRGSAPASPSAPRRWSSEAIQYRNRLAGKVIRSGRGIRPERSRGKKAAA